MLLFNNFKLGNPYLLHTPRTNYKTNVQIPRILIRIMRKILEFGALRVFRVAKGDCTGAASTCVCQRAGMVVVHKFLHDEYNVDNKVVFQNTPTSVLP
jgi:hypothetical protein